MRDVIIDMVARTAPRNLACESDGEILRLALKDDRDAWSELVRRFTPLVISRARRVGLGSADASDIAQATWLQLARKGHTIREPDRIAGWLSATAHRLSVRLSLANQRRAEPLDPVRQDLFAGAGESEAERAIEDYGLDPRLAHALDSLSEGQRRLVLILISDERLPYTEIARVLGMPVGSIGPTRQRAMTTLRRALIAC